MASGERCSDISLNFTADQELALTLCKVNDLLSEIKLSGPQRQTHMDDYFLKWTVNCYSFRCIARAYLLLLQVMYFNKLWIWPHPKFIFSGPVLSGHPVFNRHLAIPQGCPLIQVWLYFQMLKIVGNPKKGFQFVQNTKYMKIQKVHKDAKMARMEMDYDFGKKWKHWPNL